MTILFGSGSWEAVLEEIRRRRREGLPVNASALHRGPHRDNALLRAGKKLFGGRTEVVGEETECEG